MCFYLRNVLRSLLFICFLISCNGPFEFLLRNACVEAVYHFPKATSRTLAAFVNEAIINVNKTQQKSISEYVVLVNESRSERINSKHSVEEINTDEPQMIVDNFVSVSDLHLNSTKNYTLKKHFLVITETSEKLNKQVKDVWSSNKTWPKINQLLSWSMVKEQSLNGSQSVSEFATELSSSQLRNCMTIADCHLDLNERCLSNGTRNVCSCLHPFLKDPQSNVCEVVEGIKIVVRFKSTPFSQDLNKRNSPRFIQMKNSAENVLSLLLKRSEILADAVTGVQVSTFNEGSLLVSAMVFIQTTVVKRRNSIKKLDLLFATEFTSIIDKLNNSLGNFGTLVNASDVSIVEVDVDVNPCEFTELNYCSENAECVRSRGQKSRFSCKCKDGFTDSSPHPHHLGESCLVECPVSYCSNGGHCHINHEDNTLFCTCQEWNLGNRCQYSGIMVLIVFAVVVLLLMLIVGCTVSAFCARRSHTANALPTEHHEDIRNLQYAVQNHYEPSAKRIISDECPEETDVRHIRSVHNSSQSLNVGPTQITASMPAVTTVDGSLCKNNSNVVNNAYHTPRVLRVPNKTRNCQTQVTWF